MSQYLRSVTTIASGKSAVAPAHDWFARIAKKGLKLKGLFTLNVSGNVSVNTWVNAWKDSIDSYLYHSHQASALMLTLMLTIGS